MFQNTLPLFPSFFVSFVVLSRPFWRVLFYVSCLNNHNSFPSDQLTRHHSKFTSTPEGLVYLLSRSTPLIGSQPVSRCTTNRKPIQPITRNPSSLP